MFFEKFILDIDDMSFGTLKCHLQQTLTALVVGFSMTLQYEWSGKHEVIELYLLGSFPELHLAIPRCSGSTKL